MTIEVAKWKFLHAHPERRRSPRRFTDGIELKLTGVRETVKLASVLAATERTLTLLKERRAALIAAAATARITVEVHP